MVEPRRVFAVLVRESGYATCGDRCITHPTDDVRFRCCLPARHGGDFHIGWKTTEHLLSNNITGVSWETDEGFRRRQLAESSDALASHLRTRPVGKA